MEATFCTTCGYHNPPDSNYCAKCGSYLAAEAAAAETNTMSMPSIGRDPESRDPVEPAGGQGAALVLRSGGAVAGERFTLHATTTIGRSPASDIFLDDVTVSREHAVVYNDGRSPVRIEDRASLNGTYVNHDRIEKNELNHGDEIQIGKYKLTFLED
jgi:hypothetical protein